MRCLLLSVVVVIIDIATVASNIADIDVIAKLRFFTSSLRIFLSSELHYTLFRIGNKAPPLNRIYIFYNKALEHH
jgi:hypothetical protein